MNYFWAGLACSSWGQVRVSEQLAALPGLTDAMIGWDSIPPWTKPVGILITGVYAWFATFHSDKLHKTVGDKKALSRFGRLTVSILAIFTILSFVSSLRDDRVEAASRDRLERSMKAALAELQQLLRESKMPVTAYNLRVVVAFDPLAFDAQLGGKLLTPAQRAALKANVPLSPSDQSAITNSLNDHRHEVLAILFQRWEMKLQLMKRDDPKSPNELGRPVFVQDLIFSGEEGASSYFTPPDGHVRTPQGHVAAGCLLRYTVPLTGIPKLRTYSDLNGATLFFQLKAVPGNIGLEKAHAYLGVGSSGAYRESDELALYSPTGTIEWGGRWEHLATIPRDKYRMP